MINPETAICTPEITYCQPLSRIWKGLNPFGSITLLSIIPSMTLLPGMWFTNAPIPRSGLAMHLGMTTLFAVVLNVAHTVSESLLTTHCPYLKDGPRPPTLAWDFFEVRQNTGLCSDEPSKEKTEVIYPFSPPHTPYPEIMCEGLTQVATRTHNASLPHMIATSLVISHCEQPYVLRARNETLPLSQCGVPVFRPQG